MDYKKSNVVKSKSSNSAITTKSDRAKSPKNKKTRSMSNSDFQPRNLPRYERRRGVYVEKKNAKLSINGEGKERKLSKPPPRPKRNQKMFVASVLTMLSKCTTSTQYPDTKEPIKIQREKKKVKKNVSPQRGMVETGIQQSKEQTIKRIKYKSRISNDNDPLVVLKERKDIIHTPSNYSQRTYNDFTDSNRYLNLAPIINYEDKATKVQRRVSLDDGAEDKRKIVTKEKFQINREPVTLVSKNTSKEEKGLYNFFVDLLENTIETYNLNEQATAPLSGECSNVKFEIDETVARKLEVPKEDEECSESKCACSNDCDKNYNVIDEKIENMKRSVSPASKLRCSRTRSLKSRSPRTGSPRSCRSPRSPARSYQKMFPINQTFAYTQQFKESPKTQSSNMPKRLSKKLRKRTFLNSLKEQLRIDDAEFDEPRNLYEALKVMARNKRRCRKSIQFDNCVKFTTNDSPDSECWRRRRVISSSGKSTIRNKRFYDDRDLAKSFRTSSIMRTSASNYSASTRNIRTNLSKSKSNYTTDFDTESCHSIEVQVQNYEAESKILQKNRDRISRLRKISKKFIIPKTSNESLKCDFSSKDAMFKFAESIANSLAYNRANDGKYKSISQIMLGK